MKLLVLIIVFVLPNLSENVSVPVEQITSTIEAAVSDTVTRARDAATGFRVRKALH